MGSTRQLPFDIKDSGTLFYDPDHLDVDNFRKDFKAAIKDCLENSDRTDSHVLETLSGRGTLYEIIRREETLRRLDAVLSECSYNIRLFKWIVKKIQKNWEGHKKSIFFTVSHFRLWAAELLVTNRYVDKDRSFYQLVESYLDKLAMLNVRLELLANPEKRKGTEKSLLEQEEVVTKLFEDFEDRVKTVCDAIKQKQY